MADLTELLVEVSPSLKAGWILWFAGGLGLAAWFRLTRATEWPVGLQVSAAPILPLSVTQTDAAVPDAPQSSPEEAARPAKKSSRSLRRKAE